MEQENKLKGCIYKIENVKTGQMYIGQTINFSARKGAHLIALRKGKHHCRKLQSDWNIYGESCYVFSIIEEAPIDMLLMLEEKHINANSGMTFNKFVLAREAPRNPSRIKAPNQKRSAHFPGVRITPETLRKLRVILKASGKSIADLIEEWALKDYEEFIKAKGKT